MTEGQNREKQTKEVQDRLRVGAWKAMAAGYPARAVIDALRNEADRMEGK